MSKILVVEDDAEIAMAIVEVLEEAEYEVEHVVSGEKAMEKVEKGDVGMVLLDIMLPGMDGYEVLRRMKSESKYFDIPVVMLSNLGQSSEIDKAVEMGAKDYLIKANVDLSKLLEVTKKYMAG
jgi:CheY-like chemotaxis protein